MLQHIWFNYQAKQLLTRPNTGLGNEPILDKQQLKLPRQILNDTFNYSQRHKIDSSFRELIFAFPEFGLTLTGLKPTSFFETYTFAEPEKIQWNTFFNKLSQTLPDSSPVLMIKPKTKGGCYTLVHKQRLAKTIDENQALFQHLTELKLNGTEVIAALQNPNTKEAMITDLLDHPSEVLEGLLLGFGAENTEAYLASTSTSAYDSRLLTLRKQYPVFFKPNGNLKCEGLSLAAHWASLPDDYKIADKKLKNDLKQKKADLNLEGFESLCETTMKNKRPKWMHWLSFPFDKGIGFTAKKGSAETNILLERYTLGAELFNKLWRSNQWSSSLLGLFGQDSSALNAIAWVLHFK